MANLTSDAFVEEVASKIDDHMTKNDFGYYGAEYAVPDNDGTTQISVLDHMGNAVSITSTINLQ